VITNDKSMFFAHSIEGLIISKHLDLREKKQEIWEELIELDKIKQNPSLTTI
jgi:hypothetical protein